MTALPEHRRTTTITLEVDEDTAALFAKAASDREIPVEELVVGATEWLISDDEMHAREPFTPEQIAEIEEGFAQIERGEGIPHEEVFAKLREKYPDATGREIMERALHSYSELLSYAADMPILHEDADALVAEGAAAMERGDEAPQEEVFARWRANYG